MNGTVRSFATRLQALLCVVLILNMHWIHGCGTANLLSSVSAGAFQIPLTDSHPLSQALQGSAFQGAVMMEVFPPTQTFRLVYPDDDRQVSGAYTFFDGEFTITQFSIKLGLQSATMEFDFDRRVKTIISSDGQAWSRPIEDPAARQAISGPADSTNPYVAANQDLIDAAASLDLNGGANTGGSTLGQDGFTGSGGSSSGGGSGSGTAITPSARVLEGVALILVVVAGIWAPLAGILGPLVTIFTVASLLENALIFRFDGEWVATNASSDLLVTISGGKITRLIDPSSQQELDVFDTRVREVSGNRIVWTVLVNLLGQSTEVEMTFDVQEMADGKLEGTLTAMGSSFARVGVTMSRV